MLGWWRWKNKHLQECDKQARGRGRGCGRAPVVIAFMVINICPVLVFVESTRWKGNLTRDSRVHALHLIHMIVKQLQRDASLPDTNMDMNMDMNMDNEHGQ
jgi:hypothetical protein